MCLYRDDQIPLCNEEAFCLPWLAVGLSGLALLSNSHTPFIPVAVDQLKVPARKKGFRQNEIRRFLRIREDRHSEMDGELSSAAPS
jgi:hypothetical protein